VEEEEGESEQEEIDSEQMEVDEQVSEEHPEPVIEEKPKRPRGRPRKSEVPRKKSLEHIEPKSEIFEQKKDPRELILH
jgi:hypothetical protein